MLLQISLLCLQSPCGRIRTACCSGRIRTACWKLKKLFICKRYNRHSVGYPGPGCPSDGRRPVGAARWMRPLATGRPAARIRRSDSNDDARLLPGKVTAGGGQPLSGPPARADSDRPGVTQATPAAGDRRWRRASESLAGCQCHYHVTRSP